MLSWIAVETQKEKNLIWPNMLSWIAVETVSILFSIFVNHKCNWKVIVNYTHFWEVIN